MKMTRRETIAVAGAVCVAVLIAGHHLVVQPMQERIGALERVSVEKRQTVKKLRALSGEYAGVQARLATLRERIGVQASGPGILATVERAAGDCGLAGKIASMKPSAAAANGSWQESVVEVKLEEVSLKQITDFLYRLQQAGALAVKAFHLVKCARNASLLDASVQVSAVSAAVRSNDAIPKAVAKANQDR